MNKVFDWYSIASLIPNDLEDGRLIEIAIAGKNVCILKRKGLWHAFPATCPHAGAPLCQGWLDPLGRIVCPDHKYRFDPVNGRNTSGEGYKLLIYPLEFRDGELFIGLLNS